MKLEEEIKTSKPIPSRQRAFLNILFTASWLDCAITRKLRPFGLTNPQYNILRILNGSFPTGLSILDIKARMLDKSSNVSRLVVKLEEQGFTNRITHKEDRRIVMISITPKGQQLIADLNIDQFHTGSNAIGSALTEEEATILGNLLDKFRVYGGR